MREKKQQEKQQRAHQLSPRPNSISEQHYRSPAVPRQPAPRSRKGGRGGGIERGGGGIGEEGSERGEGIERGGGDKGEEVSQRGEMGER